MAERIAGLRAPWEDGWISLSDLAELLKLPAGERAELAITLWESPTDQECDDELELGPEERAKLDRRWAEHLEEPGSAVSWHDAQRKLRDGT